MRALKVFALATFAALAPAIALAAGLSFSISFPASVQSAPQDGRLILLISRKTEGEPRHQVTPESVLPNPYIFGRNVTALKPGQSAIIDASAFGWPARSLSKLKAGDYTVQVVLNRYETFHLEGGQDVLLPPDRGEGQQWAVKPENLYSKPQRIHLDPAKPTVIKIALTQTNPDIAAKPDMAGRITACLADLVPPLLPEAMAHRLLDSLAGWIDIQARDGFAPVRAAWLARSHPLGTPMRLRHGSGDLAGAFAGIADDGSIILDIAGTPRAFAAGEVRLHAGD